MGHIKSRIRDSLFQLKVSGMMLVLVASVFSFEAFSASQKPAELDEQPNILMILIDDLGYTDLGPYGGDANTPNIDALTKESILFTNAHVSPICAPTRAYFMTGKDPHKVGLGSQNGVAPPGVSLSTPGYGGSLEGEFTGLAQVLKDAGYITYHSGKWHLGFDKDQSPQALGFDENYSLLDGAASHYSDMKTIALGVSEDGKATYLKNHEKIEVLPDDFYSTSNYTTEIISMIERNNRGGQPFFAYLAYTAVHDPLHVPEDLIKKNFDAYKSGYEKLRENRISELVKRGLVADSPLAIRWLTNTPSWDNLTDRQRNDMQMRMAVYDAMIEYLDMEIGRLVDYLKKINEYENTLIVIMSDNGAAPVPRTWYTAGKDFDLRWQKEAYPLRKIEEYGKPGSFATMGMPNAQAASGPYFSFKTNLHEGGTRVPFIVKVPSSDNHFISDTFIHIADLYPTFSDYAGVELSDQDDLIGTSAKGYFERSSANIGDDEFGSAFMGWRAYRKGDWKLIFVSEEFGGTGKYALYNLASDPGEVNDISEIHPAIVDELSRKWDRYASNQGVVPVAMPTVNEFWNPLAKRLLGIDWGE